MSENLSSPPLMVEEYWANTMLSVARHYGGCTYNKSTYIITNKDGITIFELSDPECKKYYVGDGVTKAIPPGTPADLVRVDWIPVYRLLGRDKVISLAKMGTRLEKVLNSDMISMKDYHRARREMNKFLPINMRCNVSSEKVTVRSR